MDAVVAFSMDMGDGREVINKANAKRKALELDAAIRGAEVDRLMAQVRLGVLALGCIRHFQIKSKAMCAEMMCLHPKRIERATALAARLIDEKGNIDQAKLDAIRSDDGSLPCVHTAEKRLGMHAEHRSGSGTPNKVRQVCRTSGPDTRDGGRQYGDSSNARVGFHGAGPEQKERISLSPTRSGSADGGHDPEPSPGGRASTRARQAEGGAPLRGGVLAQGEAGTVGGQQLTMDVLYAGAMSEAERLIESMGELEERVGLDAAKVMSARAFFREGLAMLREAGGKKHAASGRVKDDGRGRAG